MPQTFMGVVYGTANPHVRQHVYFSDDSEFNSYRVQPGEKLIKVPYSQLGVVVVNGPGGQVISQGSDPITHNSLIASAVCSDAGVAQLSNMTFAEIDNTNTVTQIHIGDAALYVGQDLTNTYVNVQPGTVNIGYLYNPQTQVFTAPVQTVSPGNITP